jgi:hypothetical protein
VKGVGKYSHRDSVRGKDKEVDARALEKDVAGEYNTFRVYLFMLKVRKGSVRDIAKGMGFSSPWLARHHLDKLSGYGLLEKNAYGDYEVVPKRFGALKLFTLMGKWIIPHTFFVALIFLVTTLGFLPHVTEDPLFTVAFVASVIGLVFTSLLTVRMYRLLLPK